MRVSLRVVGGLVVGLALMMVFAGGIGDVGTLVASIQPPSVLSSEALDTQIPKITAGSLPEFPDNLTHFIWIVRENHDFDDYLGDCSIDINDTCNGGVSYNSTVTATKVETAASGYQLLTPDLHDFAREYAVFDNMYTTLDPYSAQAHAFIFTANAWGSTDSCATGGTQGVGPGTEWAIYNNSNVKAGDCAFAADSNSQTYNSTGGSVFDRFLGPNVPQSKTTIPFLSDGDTIWELAPTTNGCKVASSKAIPGDSEKSLEIVTGCKTGWWYNSTSGSGDMPPTVNEVTGIPQELWECEYYCTGAAPSTFLDSYPANSFIDYVNDYGLPTYTFIELFDDHPGNNCGSGQPTCISENDAAMGSIVNDIENNSAYRNNTVIAVTEDETQDGQNDLDHENSGRRVPFVLIAPHSVEKSGGAPSTCGIATTYPSCGFVEHQTFNYSNVLAVMERVEMNVNPSTFYIGGISPNSTKFPMVENDYLAENDPLEPVWKCGEPGVPCNTGVATGPSISSFTASPSTIANGGTDYLNTTASGGLGPLTYAYTGLPTACASSNASKITCSTTVAGPYTVTVTVTDSSAAKRSATSSASFTVLPSSGGIVLSSYTAGPPTIYLGGTSDLNVTAVGGSAPYTYVYTGYPTGCSSADTSSLACTPTISGSFTIDVNVTDHAGAYATGSVPLTVKPMTITSFSASPSTIAPGGTSTLAVTVNGGFVPLTYAYTGLPTGCSSSNAASITCSPSVTSGNFSVTVTATDVDSNKASASTWLNVSNAPPTLTSLFIVPGSATVAVNASKLFYAQALSQYDTEITTGITYTWSLSRALGSLSSSGNETTLTGTTSGTTFLDVDATQSGNPNHFNNTAPVNIFGVSGSENVTSGTVPLAVSFSASQIGGAGTVSYSWAFGNSATSTLQNPSYTYTKAGTYDPVVTATDSEGNVASWHLPAITAAPNSSTGTAPTVSISASPTSGTEPLNVSFTALVSGGSGTYVTYTWTFGDNSQATGASVYHTYHGTGTFPVEVAVTDSKGNTGYGFTNITVKPSQPSNNNNSQSSSGTPIWEYVAIGVIAILAIALIAVLVTRPRKPEHQDIPQWGQPPR